MDVQGGSGVHDVATLWWREQKLLTFKVNLSTKIFFVVVFMCLSL